jgi:2-(1,2-epoxy-1,2-dihydrophenyl)acetyl-CoA isomerase
MTYETILYEMSDGIGRLTLNRPERLNSFTVAMHAEVRALLESLAREPTLRVLILSGAGRGFCAGQDLSDRAVRTSGEAPVDLGESMESPPERGPTSHSHATW